MNANPAYAGAYPESSAIARSRYVVASRQTRLVLRRERHLDRLRDRESHLPLERHHVATLAHEAVAPHARVRRRIDQVRRDPDAVTVLENRPLHHVLHLQ